MNVNFPISQQPKLNNKKISRYSKISSALKKQLLLKIQQTHAPLRIIAQQLKINYSTAKVIVQRNKTYKGSKNKQAKQQQDEYFPKKQRKIKYQNKKQMYCTYRVLGEDQIQNNVQPNGKKMEIITTIGWNFMEFGYPKIDPAFFQSYEKQSQSHIGVSLM